MSPTEAAPNGDFGQSHPWSEDLKERLAAFRQGHIIEGIPVFFGSLGANQLWSQPRERLSVVGPDLTIEPDGVLHHAIVLTQGCDIALPKTPWVTLAPVYDATQRLSSGQQASAKGGQTHHLVHITADWASNGFWVADLRLEMPIEKTALLGRQPLEAFADAADYSRFSTRLAVNRQRPDVPNAVLENVVGPLFTAVRDRVDAGQPPLPYVRELRIQLDDPLTPTTVVLFVVANDGTAPNIDDWTEVVAAIYPGAEAAGLTLLGPEMVTLDSMTTRDYLTSSPIDDAPTS